MPPRQKGLWYQLSKQELELRTFRIWHVRSQGRKCKHNVDQQYFCPFVRILTSVFTDGASEV
jgi:hypothetical protein